MRRWAISFAFLWLSFALSIRLYDMRKPHTYISTLTGGQRHDKATLAWLQGPMPHNGAAGRGRMVVVDTRIDGKIERYASATLPTDWLECRLWLEEGPQVIQAVAGCPGVSPVRLTAAGQSLPGLGPDNKPPSLYEVSPLTAVEPERIVNKIHRQDYAPTHPILLLLGILAMLPLGALALQTFRRAQKLRGKTVLEGVIEQSDAGALTIRSGERHVTVFVEEGELISVGLAGDVLQGSSMAFEGVHAAVGGDVEVQKDAAFRGGETMRLRPGAVLVVGDLMAEARNRLMVSTVLHVGVAAAGIGLAALVSLGLGF